MAEDEEGLSSLAPVSSQRNSLSGDDKQQSAGHPEMLTTRNRRRSSRRLTLTKSCSQSNLDRNHAEEKKVVETESAAIAVEASDERKVNGRKPFTTPPVFTRSDTNLSLFLPLRNPIKDRLNRFGSVNSWTGSECSESSLLSSSTSCLTQPPLVHNMPYHKDGWTSLFIVGSSTYAQLMIVICIVVALSEVVTSSVPFNYFEGFFTYMYCGSILFFLYVFFYLLRSQRHHEQKRKERRYKKWLARKQTNDTKGSHSTSVGIEEEASTRRHWSLLRRGSREIGALNVINWSPSTFSLNLSEEATATAVSNAMNSDHVIAHNKKMKVSENEHSHGSFFLRAGAVAFGIGTMIYDGLEFGAFLEIPHDSPCHFILRGVNPALHAVFTFLQMYFIFISARLNIHKFKFIARFGLMHCVATNVCVWIRTLVRESLKEIRHHHGDDDHHTVADYAGVENETIGHHSLWELTSNVSCGRNIFLGDFILDAAPFLYPFLIEYSLIGAAVLHLCWTHVGLSPKFTTEDNAQMRLIKSQLRVDCLGASKGLFLGLFCLAASLLCLVLFFVLTTQEEYRLMGLILADTAHCSLLLASLIAIAIGAFRTRNLEFHAEHAEELGSMLLRVSALGIFAYSAFSVTAGALSTSTEEPPILVLANGLLSIIEVTVQMLFISDMSRRRVGNPEQDLKKPGRQTVTFLLIINMTLWLVYTFEMQKLEANPVQMKFYGLLPWTIVQRMTLPLCIFYRFHSAIIYAEIWKNTYRFAGLPS